MSGSHVDDTDEEDNSHFINGKLCWFSYGQEYIVSFFWLTVYIDLVLSVQIRNVNDTIMANIKTAVYYNMQLMNCTVLCSCCLS